LSWEDNPGFSEWENNHKGPYWKDARRRSAEEKKEITLGGGERKRVREFSIQVVTRT
jgi:hypothetical protein